MTVPKPPKHPVSQLVTWELSAYRTRLENALTSAPGNDAESQLISTRLAEVAREQDERAHVFQIPGTWAAAL